MTETGRLVTSGPRVFRNLFHQRAGTVAFGAAMPFAFSKHLAAGAQQRDLSDGTRVGVIGHSEARKERCCSARFVPMRLQIGRDPAGNAAAEAKSWEATL